MKRTRYVTPLCSLLVAASAFAACTPLGVFNSWSSEIFPGNPIFHEGPRCVASTTTKARSASKVGGTGVLAVAREKKGSGLAVTTVANHGFQRESRVWLDVGGNLFDLHARNDIYMAGMLESAEPVEMAKVIRAMQIFKEVTVHGATAAGESFSDTYSLEGFGKALHAIDQACGTPAHEVGEHR